MAYFRASTLVNTTAAAGRTFLAVDSPTFPYIQVTRIGGPEDGSDAPMDLALIQIDIYGRVRQLDEANTVRRGVRQALSALDETAYTATGKGRLLGAVVRDERRFPTANQQDAGGVIGERPRYIITALVTCIAD